MQIFTAKTIAQILNVAISTANSYRKDIVSAYNAPVCTEWHFKDYFKIPQDLDLAQYDKLKQKITKTNEILH